MTLQDWEITTLIQFDNVVMELSQKEAEKAQKATERKQQAKR